MKSKPNVQKLFSCKTVMFFANQMKLIKKNFKTFILLFLLIIVFAKLNAQVAITIDGNSADGSAMLDIQSTDKGMLIPRMDEAQRIGISDPASGLLVFQTDGSSGFYFYDGSEWQSLNASNQNISSISDADGDTKVQVEENADEDKIRFDVAGAETMVIDETGSEISGTSSLGILKLNGGDSNDGANNLTQIAFGFNGTDDYPQFISTRHNAIPANNSFDFYTNDGTQNGVFPPNAIHGLTITNGKVGIGTTTPSEALEVVGAVKIGDYTLPALDGTTNQFLQSNGSGTVSWVDGSWTQNGNNIYRNTGNVGIGTSEPAGLFHVNRSFYYTGETLDQDQPLGWFDDEEYNMLWQSFTAGMSGYLSKIDIHDASTSNGTFTLKIYSGEGTAGSLLGTSNPVSRNNNGWEYVTFNFPDSIPVTTGQQYTAVMEISGGFWHIVLAVGNVYSGGISFFNGSSDPTDDIKFRTYVADTFIAPTILLVNDNGNFGIGTTTPSQTLDVNGNISAPQIMARDDSGLNLCDNDENGIFIDDGGYIGIGTTSPEYPLHVVSNVTKNIGWYGYLDNTGITGTSNATGNYSIGASGYIAAPAFCAYSDRRIKTNIIESNMTSDLNKINQLRLVNYNYIDKIEKGSNLQKGFIAQEVEKLIPEAVKQNSDFIPDIFMLASKIEMDNDKLIIEIEKEHNLKTGDLVRLITNKGPTEICVTNIVSSTSFSVKMDEIPETIFVYGKRVDDFRAIDYDYIFSTGIGAIKELSSKVDELENSNNYLLSKVEQIDKLTAEVEKLKSLMVQGNILANKPVME